MKRTSRTTDAIKLSACLFILVLCVFASSYPFFQDGLIAGDDTWFHLPQIQDVYYGMRHGFWGLSPNHQSVGTIGIYVYQFYGPFPHYSSAFLLYLFNPLGMDSLSALKTATVLSILVSVFYSFALGKKVTGNRVGGLVAGVAYAFNPYRIFCSFRRGAFAEVVAIAFIPMIFYGLYRILHDRKTAIFPYVSLILGVSLIVLSHPFTAVMTICFFLLYLLFHPKKVFEYAKSWKRLLLGTLSILLIFGFISFYAFPMLKARAEDLYRITDAEQMLTNPNSLSDSTFWSHFFSGVLPFDSIDYWLSVGQWDPLEKPVDYEWALSFLFLAIACAIAFDFLLSRRKLDKRKVLLADLLLLFLIANLVRQPLEFFIALFVFYALFCYFRLAAGKDEKGEDEPSTLLRNPDFYYASLSLFALGLLIFVDALWFRVPSFMLQAQFAWRLWSLFYFEAILLVSVLLKHLGKLPFATPVSIASSVALIALGSGLPYARNVYRYQSGTTAFFLQMDDEGLKYIDYVGSQSEYLPKIFREEYVSPYPNSLYPVVKSMTLGGEHSYGIDTYQTPVFLQGEGSLRMDAVNAPNISFSIEVSSEDALIQIPQLYNDGYVAHLSESERTTKGRQVDGLVSFDLPQGSYRVDVRFEGSDLYQVGNAFLSLSFVGTSSMIATWAYLSRKRRRYGEEIDF